MNNKTKSVEIPKDELYNARIQFEQDWQKIDIERKKTAILTLFRGIDLCLECNFFTKELIELKYKLYGND